MVVNSFANNVLPNFYVYKTLHQRLIQKWVELSCIIHVSVFNTQVYLVNTNSFLVGQLVVELCWMTIHGRANHNSALVSVSMESRIRGFSLLTPE